MNGIHDMGGMHGMGPIEYEQNEPVFHAQWEARVYALTRAVRFIDDWNLDASRHAIEQLPPADYLRMSYYEKWLVRAEARAGKLAADSAKSKRPLTAEMVPAVIAKGSSARRDVSISPAFAAGQRVRACNINPPGHTRLPRYARGKLGTIARNYGVFVFPDTRAHFRGDKPQHVYSVRFEARELWGSQANPRDGVYVDLWEDYLEPA